MHALAAQIDGLAVNQPLLAAEEANVAALQEEQLTKKAAAAAADGPQLADVDAQLQTLRDTITALRHVRCLLCNMYCHDHVLALWIVCWLYRLCFGPASCVLVSVITWGSYVHGHAVLLQERDRVASAGAEAHTLKLKQRELLAKQAELEGKLSVYKDRVLGVLGVQGAWAMHVAVWFCLCCRLSVE